MWHLLKLSDKYIVPSLQEDVRVRSFLRLSLMLQNYSVKLIAAGRPKSFTLWKYSARYSLMELEKYCRSDPAVFAVINYLLRQPARGLPELLRYGIPLEMLNELVMDIAGLVPQESKSCRRLSPRCREYTGRAGALWPGGLCSACVTEVASLGIDHSKEMNWPYSD